MIFTFKILVPRSGFELLGALSETETEIDEIDEANEDKKEFERLSRVA